MRAVLQEHYEKHGTIDDVETSVRERQNSTRFLIDATKEFVFLLDESILRGKRFPAQIMRAQLFQLMTASNLDTETALADERKLLADDVAILERLFARYWQDAVTGDDARAMISDAMTALS